MKYTITIMLFTLLQLTLKASGTYTVGSASGNDYPNLYAAFDDVNNGIITGALIFQVTSNLVETDPIMIDSSGFGPVSYSSILIYPTNPNTLITGDFASSSLFDLNGAKYVTIDGRINATGSTINLQLVNTAANNATNHSVVFLRNNAQYNKIQYCDVSTNGTTGFPFHFSSGIAPSNNNVHLITNGNSFNKISHNKVHAGTISKIQSAVYSSGVGNAHNHTDTISNNEFFNIVSFSTNVIYLLDRTYGWYIANNSFYEPTAQTVSTYYRAINVHTTHISLPGHIIENNFIGGTAPQCGGTPFALNGGFAIKYFCGIRIVSGGAFAHVRNNTIKNIQITQNSNQAEYSIYGVEHGFGKCVLENNTIGSELGNHSITNSNSSFQPSVPNNGISGIVGIWSNGADSVYIRGNKIGSLSTYQDDINYKASIAGIVINNVDSRLVIENNLIGSNNTVKSIQANCASMAIQNVVGIHCLDGLGVAIRNNEISHLFNGKLNGNGSAVTAGIHAAGSCDYLIHNNTIKNISSDANIANDAVRGILSIGGTLRVISNNKIFNLRSTNATTDASTVSGIAVEFQNQANVTGNFIHSLSGASPLAIIRGIKVIGTALMINNIISLTTAGGKVVGIYNGGNSNVQHNTIYLSGIPTNTQTICLENINIPPTVRCNIFVNTNRNVSGNTKNHFCVINNVAIAQLGTINGQPFYNTTFNGNNYRAPSTTLGAAVGYMNSTNYNTFLHWVTATGQEANGMSIDPQFTLAGGTTASNYYPNAALSTIPVGITEDFFGNIRSTTLPIPGALESQSSLPVQFAVFSLERIGNTNRLTWETLSEIETSHFVIERSLDALSWENIGELKASGNSNERKFYQFDDNESLIGNIFYRIKQIDLDDRYAYSKVEKIYISSSFEINVYPNPCSMILSITLKDMSKPYIAEIYSIAGNRLITQEINSLNSKINVESLTKGNYLIRLFNKEKTIMSKFTRQ
jgi:hypothetical protein